MGKATHTTVTVLALLYSVAVTATYAQTPGIALGDLDIVASSESLAVSQAVYGRLHRIGAWNAYACNNTQYDMLTTSGRVYSGLALAGLHPVNKDSLLQLLDRARYERPASKIARAGEWGVIAVAVLSAQAGASMRMLQYATAAIPVAKRVSDAARERVYVFDTSRLMDGALSIPAGDCQTYVFFSGIVKGASKPVKIIVKARLRKSDVGGPTPGITSVP